MRVLFQKKIPASNQKNEKKFITKLKNSTLYLKSGDWNSGTLEPWNFGTLEPWNLGTLELWNLELWNLEPGTVYPNILLTCFVASMNRSISSMVL